MGPPTDTAYGLGSDASLWIASLLEAKGRGRDFPLPVLVGTPGTLDGLSYLGFQSRLARWWRCSGPARSPWSCATHRAWPGDIGDAEGKVALRMPLHPLALELLRTTGPMAVTSANRSGLPVPATAVEAQDQLGDAVSVYLDADRRPTGCRAPSSTPAARSRSCSAPAPSASTSCARSAPTSSSPTSPDTGADHDRGWDGAPGGPQEPPGALGSPS